MEWLLALNPFEKAMIFAALWGFVYNIVNTHADKTGFNDFYRPATIAFGVFITLLIASPAIGYENTLMMLSIFAAAGISMVAGGFVSILRRWQHPRFLKKQDVGEQLKKNRRELEEQEVE